MLAAVRNLIYKGKFKLCIYCSGWATEHPQLQGAETLGKVVAVVSISSGNCPTCSNFRKEVMMDLVTRSYMAWQAFSRGHGSGPQRLSREPGLAAAGSTK